MTMKNRSYYHHKTSLRQLVDGLRKLLSGGMTVLGVEVFTIVLTEAEVRFHSYRKRMLPLHYHALHHHNTEQSTKNEECIIKMDNQSNPTAVTCQCSCFLSNDLSAVSEPPVDFLGCVEADATLSSSTKHWKS
ncbi:hypothetical protein KIN20_014291 [Parelaphostrongylus tenuis]|uniref:Uncharacterized protein n=1 Tax=Parelaphostrongylus tenuis TaxID=148309 RepID=A0AAD5QRQ9_PARTN|nr:hypothetical protein KIN20_014291 [Parelaphostrongylus tenuis]